MLTGIIVAGLVYAGIFAVLWSRTRFVARRVPLHPAPEPIRVVPYLNHLYVSAPTDAEAVEAFLRKDLELAGRPQ